MRLFNNIKSTFRGIRGGGRITNSPFINYNGE